MKTIAGLLMLLSVGFAVMPALAEPRYTVLDLGTLPGDSRSFGEGINGSGEVTGYSTSTDGPTHAFLYNGSNMVAIGTLGGSFSIGLGINDQGEVAGQSTTSNSADYAFLYNGQVLVNLGALGGNLSEGTAVNNIGEVTGSACISTAGNTPCFAFLYNGTNLVNLGTLPGYFASSGFGINDSGDIAGELYTTTNTGAHAFLYRGGVIHDLGTLGGTDSAAYGINSLVEVTGQASTTGNASTHAFLYNGTEMLDLGIIAGTIDSTGSGINDRGEVVGGGACAVSTCNRDGSVAFLYTGGLMLDLNTLIVPTDPLYTKISLSYALGINATSAIVANGCYTSGQLQGQCHASRLDPVRFAGTPGQANCTGQSIAALVTQFGGLNRAAAALGYSSVSALQEAIEAFCAG